MSDVLVDIFKHHKWANLKLIDACADLSEEQLQASAVGTYGSIRDTLFHFVENEFSYLTAIPESGIDLAYADRVLEDGWPGFSELRRMAGETGDLWIERAGALSANPVLHGERDGETWEMPASIFFTQAIDHGTEHRTHIRAILTMIGIEPPNLDSWTWSQTLT